MINKNLIAPLIDKILPLVLLCLIISIPTSSTFRSIFLILSIVLIILNPVYQTLLYQYRKEPLMLASVGIFLLAFIGCFYGDATISEKISTLEKYTKFLFFPILIVAFYNSHFRFKALNTYLASMTIVLLISILKWTGLLKFGNIYLDHIFYNHIITGLMMGYAAYISASLAWSEDRKLKPIYILLLILFTFQIFFLSYGRTGYIIYVLLMFLFLIQTLTLRAALISLVAGLLIITSIYFNNPIMHNGINNIFKDVASYKSNDKETPIGQRLQFHDFSKKLFFSHPILGNGTSGFGHAFKLEKPVSSWGPNLAEPHSQYWLILAEFGLFGSVMFLLFLYTLFRTILKLKDMRMIAIGLFFMFLFGNLTDSLFYYSSTGVFFLTMMALCLGEQFDNNR